MSALTNKYITLALCMYLIWAAPVGAQEHSNPGKLSLESFRGFPENTRLALVVGVLTIVDHAGLVCIRPGTAGEYHAALLYRNFHNIKRPWIEFMLFLMDERDCAVPQEKPNA